MSKCKLNIGLRNIEIRKCFTSSKCGKGKEVDTGQY